MPKNLIFSDKTILDGFCGVTLTGGGGLSQTEKSLSEKTVIFWHNFATIRGEGGGLAQKGFIRKKMRFFAKREGVSPNPKRFVSEKMRFFGIFCQKNEN